MSPRVVFDTNVVVSALLFPAGHVAWLRQAWHRQAVVPLVNKLTMQEVYRVLSYPKFALSGSDREELLGDYLPFAELVKMPAKLPNLPKCRDRHDQKFMELAAAAKADMLVTGDQDLLALTGKLHFSICSVVELQANLEAGSQSRGP